MDWQEAWKRDKHAVGRAVHEAWAAERIWQGFADHPLEAYCPPAGACDGDACEMRKPCHKVGCDLSPGQHTNDMIDFDDLAPHIQEYDYATGIIGYRLGFEAGARAAAGGDG